MSLYQELVRLAGGSVTPRRAGNARRCPFALALALWPVTALAQAGPPYETDDPDPVEYRHWEFYIATQHVKDPDGVSGTAPHVEVNYGVVPGLQLHLLVPYAYARPTGGPTAFGPGDIEVGAKVRFVREGRWWPMIGTFVQTEWPAGDARSGLGTGRLHVLLPIWLQKSWGRWTSDAGGGYFVNPGPGNRDFWLLGWQAAYQAGDDLTVGGELFHTTPDQVGASGSLRTKVGFVLDITPRHHLLASLGYGLAGARLLQSYLGYQLTVGPGAGFPP